MKWHDTTSCPYFQLNIITCVVFFLVIIRLVLAAFSVTRGTPIGTHIGQLVAFQIGDGTVASAAAFFPVFF